MAGCTNTVVVDNYCALYRPVSTSAADTAETSAQIDVNNGIYECKCNRDCPK